MKDEIKEILDRWNKVCNGELLSTDMTLDEMIMFRDYITNLREKNKHLDEINCHLRKKINNDIYKQRNKKAIEYIKAVGITPKQIDSFVLLNILTGGDE